MKKIEAIIRPERLTHVKMALEQLGILGMTVMEVSGRGRQKGIALQWKVGEYRVDFLPKVKVEVVLDDSECDRVVTAMCDAARTGKTGDGMVFISPVEKVIRVRTGEDCSCGIRPELVATT
jgi:nitrogen regulatory protein P-II 1